MLEPKPLTTFAETMVRTHYGRRTLQWIGERLGCSPIDKLSINHGHTPSARKVALIKPPIRPVSKRKPAESGMRYFLTINGNRFQAARAAADRGILMAFQHEYQNVDGDFRTVGCTELWSSDHLRTWHNEVQCAADAERSALCSATIPKLGESNAERNSARTRNCQGAGSNA